jgi:membrane protein
VVDEQDIEAKQGTEQSGKLAASSREAPAAAHQPGPSRVSALRDKGATTVARVKRSSAGTYWSRLTAVDFMNSSMVFAALSLLCLFPFFTIVAAATGRSTRHTLIIRMGLNHQAAADIDNLISSGHNAVTNLTILSCIFLAFGVIGLSATLQGWYQRVYDLPSQGALKTLVCEILWFLSFLIYIVVQVQIGQHVGPMGAHVLIFGAEFICALIFWTLSAYILLLGRVEWAALLPTGIATAICVTGLALFSFLLFSSSIISGFNNYGPIGVMSTLLSYFIGLGVCIHLGAMFGRMWDERHDGRVELSESLCPESATSGAGQG